MRSALRESERELYDTAWGVDAYAANSPGAQLVPVFMDMAFNNPKAAMNRGSVLDAGCGSGKGAIALEAAGFHVQCCDLTDAGMIPEARRFPFHECALWGNLKGAIGQTEWVYCTDVLEHVPTPFTMLVVSRLLEVATFGVFLSICTQPDQFGVWVGKPLHQTVQSFVMWRDQLSALAHVVEARDLLTNGVYLLEPR